MLPIRCQLAASVAPMALFQVSGAVDGGFLPSAASAPV